VISLRGVCLVGCLLIFNQNLGAFSRGPLPDRNGFSGVYCTQCHTTNALNSGPGSVRIVGLPSAWLPNETYRLQVIVSDPIAIRFGFELSATGVANRDQAGVLIPATDGRTQILEATIDGKVIQFLEHTSLGSTIGSSNVFQFTYRTPADPNFGSIRFNVAGNAANGNGANTGDFIYATEVIVPLLVPSSERQFVLATRGSLTAATAGATTGLSIGFARMQTSSGTAGSGLAFVSYRQGGVLVSEAAFAASAPILSGRTYVEVGGALNTGIALVNPGSQAASVSFFFTDATGTNFGESNISIPPNSQIAAFVNEAPFRNALGSRPISDARTFTFFTSSSAALISAAAVRTRLNERAEFMMTALPIAEVPPGADRQIETSSTSIAHIADGGGWATEVLLVNTDILTATGTLQFFSSAGQNLTVTLDGQNGNQFPYSIPGRSSRRFRTAGIANIAATGWILIAPSGGTATPSAAGVLSARANNVTVTETAIAAVFADNAFRVFAEVSGDLGAPGSIQSGFAVSNPGNSPINVNLEVTGLDGTVVIASTPLSIPAHGQFADIVRLNLPLPFTGVTWVSAPAGSAISVSGFRGRLNERSTPDLVLTAFPAFNERGTSASNLVFPQVVDAAGYSTEFALVGARPGQSAGTLRFVSQVGQPLLLPLR
jgi:hypothetical protein